MRGAGHYYLGTCLAAMCGVCVCVCVCVPCDRPFCDFERCRSLLRLAAIRGGGVCVCVCVYLVTDILVILRGTGHYYLVTYLAVICVVCVCVCVCRYMYAL